VMLSVRDLIRALRFPLQEVSDWISLARASLDLLSSRMAR
jgi:hypothetical protein